MSYIKFSMQAGGEPELRTALRLLENAVAVDILASATKIAAEPVLARAIELAPVDTGTLKREGLQIKVKRRSRGGRIYAEANVTNTRKGAHAILQEFGVAPHRVRGSQHPGHKAKPFMRRAFVNKRDEALRIVTARIRESVLKAAAAAQAKSPTFDGKTL